MLNTMKLEHLVDQLDCADQQRQRTAAQILIRLGKASPSNLILTPDVNDDENYTAAITGIILQIGSSAVEALIHMLETKPSLPHQRIIIDILGRIGDSRAFEPLKAVLASNNHALEEVTLEALLNITARKISVYIENNTSDQPKH